MIGRLPVDAILEARAKRLVESGGHKDRIGKPVDSAITGLPVPGYVYHRDGWARRQKKQKGKSS